VQLLGRFRHDRGRSLSGRSLEKSVSIRRSSARQIAESETIDSVDCPRSTCDRKPVESPERCDKPRASTALLAAWRIRAPRSSIGSSLYRTRPSISKQVHRNAVSSTLSSRRGRERMQKDRLKFLKTYMNTVCPTGYEEDASRVWREEANDSRSHVGRRPRQHDRSHQREGAVPRHARSHADEIGLLISYADDQGYLSFTDSAAGSDNPSGQRVRIRTQHGSSSA